VKVVVLTTSYPRFPGDAAGSFVAAGVERIRGAGTDVEVVSPSSFRDFGIAYGAGIVGNLRAQPWRAMLLPAFLAAFTRAARRAARDADVVHAHWLPAGAVAAATGRPFVVQLWGTDVELARRAPAVARAILRRARIVVCPSTALATAALEFGARDVRVVPNGVALPPTPAQEAHPPHVLYVGRLSAEKGVEDLVAAAVGLPLVVVGDGPLRDRVSGAIGEVPTTRVGQFYERAAVVACPSRREGFGMACLEAMAHGRPVVATAVGGLTDLVRDGETGLLVPPRNPGALRAALETLLGDGELRSRLGAAGRERAHTSFAWPGIVASLLDCYAEASRASR
jgi:glycosyltransferase involved in cell wall biosynthesis